MLIFQTLGLTQLSDPMTLPGPLTRLRDGHDDEPTRFTYRDLRLYHPGDAQRWDTVRTELDRSRPVPAKSQALAAWRARQNAVGGFRFEWTERQVHPTGWLSNPRYPERERASIPALNVDRTYVVTKTLTVHRDSMRYTFEIDRPEEPDGIRVTRQGGGNRGLGVHRHYTYVSAFDGRHTVRTLTTSLDGPPPTTLQSTANFDAQNLDGRPIMMALRPLDPVLGDLLLDRAVTNLVRTFYRGKSTFLLEERHDPSGWKTIRWIEPEREFLVSRFLLLFEQKPIADIDIDYTHDARWGWVPTGWRVTELLADQSRRLVSTASVTRYHIDAP